MSDYEYLTLMVNHHILFTRKDWDCDKCLRVPQHILDRGGEALTKIRRNIESRRIGLGCEGGDRKIVELDRFIFTKCPGNLRSPAAFSFYQMYSSYRRNGTMPYPGSMSEQPAKVFDFFEVFGWLDNVADEKERKRKK